MADEVIQPVVEAPAEVTPAPAQAPAAPVEPVDERGVPYKNVIAEYNRKLEEQRALNLQYQAALGQLQQQRTTPPPPVVDVDENQWDEGSRAIMRKIAAQVAREEATKIANQVKQQAYVEAEQNPLLNDPTFRPIAEQEWQKIQAHPVYSQWANEAKQALAIANAKVIRAQQVSEAQRTTQTNQALQNANSRMADAGSIPSTSGSVGVSATGNKETDIKAYMADPENRRMFRGFHRADPDSPEGQKAFRRVAEAWYSGIDFGPTVGTAVQVLGGRQ